VWQVGIKVNSRKVLGSVLDMFGVPVDKFQPVCIVVDKLDKIGPEEVKRQLVHDLAVPQDSADKIIASLGCKSIDELVALTGGTETAAVAELKELFRLAEDYGFSDFLLFDASVVRALPLIGSIAHTAHAHRLHSHAGTRSRPSLPLRGGVKLGLESLLRVDVGSTAWRWSDTRRSGAGWHTPMTKSCES
jgi:hypothetical protein